MSDADIYVRTAENRPGARATVFSYYDRTQIVHSVTHPYYKQGDVVSLAPCCCPTGALVIAHLVSYQFVILPRDEASSSSTAAAADGYYRRT